MKWFCVPHLALRSGVSAGFTVTNKDGVFVFITLSTLSKVLLQYNPLTIRKKILLGVTAAIKGNRANVCFFVA